MGRLRDLFHHRAGNQSNGCRPAQGNCGQGGALAARCSGGSAPPSTPGNPPAQGASSAPQPSQASGSQATSAAPSAQAPARNPATPPAAGQAPAASGEGGWGGFGGRLIEGLGRAFGIERPEVKPEEREAIDRMIAQMPELAGADGRFNRGDLGAIQGSVQGELRGVVNSEINRRAQQRVNQAGPLARPFVRMGAQAHLRRHRGEYQAMGMRQGNEQVRGGLNEAFDRMGDRTTQADADGQRRLSLDDLRRFGQDAQVLEQISQRAQAMGLPRFEFPRGIGAEDLAAIRDGRMPPNGVPIFRKK